MDDENSEKECLKTSHNTLFLLFTTVEMFPNAVEIACWPLIGKESHSFPRPFPLNFSIEK